jgi:hypothetical protein
VKIYFKIGHLVTVNNMFHSILEKLKTFEFKEGNFIRLEILLKCGKFETWEV